MNQVDQASVLRNVVKQMNLNDKHVMNRTKIIAVTSGKGGVGKTNFSANLAIALAHHRKRVLILDADLGLANIDVLFGIYPQYNLGHVIRGEKALKDVIVEGPSGIKIAPGSSGLKDLANLSKADQEVLLNQFYWLDGKIDYLIIDTAAGIAENVTNFAVSSDEVVVITTPEPTSITDAYATIKVLFEEKNDIQIRLVVNMANSFEEAQQVFEKIKLVCLQFIGKKIQYLGAIIKDPNVLKSIRSQKPYLNLFPNTSASKSIKNFALYFNHSLKEKPIPNENNGIRNFIHKLLGIKS